MRQSFHGQSPPVLEVGSECQANFNQLILGQFHKSASEVNMNETIVKGCFIVSLYDDENNLVGRILWGTIEHDHSHRFESGDYVCTSPILSESDGIVVTKNSRYEVIGTPSCIDLPLGTIIQLRAGIDPQLCLLTTDDKSQD